MAGLAQGYTLRSPEPTFVNHDFQSRFKHIGNSISIPDAVLNSLLAPNGVYTQWMFPSSGDLAQEFCLKYELALLILLTRLICLVVLPSNRLLALLAEYVSHHVPARSHISVTSFA